VYVHMWESSGEVWLWSARRR